MLVKQNGRLYTLFTCQWLQSMPKRVCIWSLVFHRIQRGRLHLAGKRRRRGSIGAFMRLCSVSVVTSLQNSANLSSALMLFNVLMVMTASDRPSAAESDFLCRHTHIHTQTVSMQEQIATQHQAKKELELLHVYLYSTNASLHVGDCAIIQ